VPLVGSVRRMGHGRAWALMHCTACISCMAATDNRSCRYASACFWSQLPSASP